MATFVVHLHMSPNEYYGLTFKERNAIVAAWNTANKKR